MAMPRSVALGALLVPLLWGQNVTAFCSCDAASQCSAIASASQVILGVIGGSVVSSEGIEYNVQISKSFYGGLSAGVGITVVTKDQDCGSILLADGQEYVLSLVDSSGAFELSNCAYNSEWAYVSESDKSMLESGQKPGCETSGSGDVTSELDVTSASVAIADSTTSEAAVDSTTYVIAIDPTTYMVAADSSTYLAAAESTDPTANVLYESLLGEVSDDVHSTVVVDYSSTTTETSMEVNTGITPAVLETGMIYQESTFASATTTTAIETATVLQGSNVVTTVTTIIPGINGCMNGQNLVANGWTGAGAEVNNECNICFCVNGYLACTKRVCRQQSS